MMTHNLTSLFYLVYNFLNQKGLFNDFPEIKIKQILFF